MECKKINKTVFRLFQAKFDWTSSEKKGPIIDDLKPNWLYRNNNAYNRKRLKKAAMFSAPFH